MLRVPNPVSTTTGRSTRLLRSVACRNTSSITTSIRKYHNRLTNTSTKLVCLAPYSSSVSRSRIPTRKIRPLLLPYSSSLRVSCDKHHRSIRALSSNSSDEKKGSTNSSSNSGVEDSLVLTPGEKVVAGTRLTMFAGLFVFGSFCAYYIGKELIPTKMSPNKVFDKAFEEIKNHKALVQRMGGSSLKAYGREHGGHREGRRNFVEHTEYVDKEDGSKRTRVRFNLEGQFGTAFVFAEVSSAMPSGEFVYILVQDKRNGQVTTVVDNRSALMAQRMAGGSAEGLAAFSNLLSGGGSSK